MTPSDRGGFAWSTAQVYNDYIILLTAEAILMSTPSAVSSVESAPIVPENGTSELASSFPVSLPEDMLYEVVDGKIVEKIVGVYEADIATLLIRFLAPFVAAHRLGRVLGETIFRIDQAKNLQRRPDVAFVSDARWPAHRKPPKVAVWDMVPEIGRAHV